MKRAKDNSGTGYSYGTAVAALGNTAAKSVSYPKNVRCACKDQVIVTPKDDMYGMHVLRTSAINSDTVNDIPVVEVVSLSLPFNRYLLSYTISYDASYIYTTVDHK